MEGRLGSLPTFSLSVSEGLTDDFRRPAVMGAVHWKQKYD